MYGPQAYLNGMLFFLLLNTCRVVFYQTFMVHCCHLQRNKEKEKKQKRRERRKKKKKKKKQKTDDVGCSFFLCIIYLKKKIYNKCFNKKQKRRRIPSNTRKGTWFNPNKLCPLGPWSGFSCWIILNLFLMSVPFANGCIVWNVAQTKPKPYSTLCGGPPHRFPCRPTKPTTFNPTVTLKLSLRCQECHLNRLWENGHCMRYRDHRVPRKLHLPFNGPFKNGCTGWWEPPWFTIFWKTLFIPLKNKWKRNFRLTPE